MSIITKVIQPENNKDLPEEIILKWEKFDPYKKSFVIAALMMAISMVIPTTLQQPDTGEEQRELEYLDITVVRPQKVQQKEISSEEGEVVEDTTQETGEQSSQVVDLAFYPGIDKPRLLSRLKKQFPADARDLQVEAQAGIELVINTSGRVQNVKVLYVSLSKNLPPEAAARIKQSFSTAAVKMLSSARYSQTVFEGKPVPIRYETVINFRLDD